MVFLLSQCKKSFKQQNFQKQECMHNDTAQMDLMYTDNSKRNNKQLLRFQIPWIFAPRFFDEDQSRYPETNWSHYQPVLPEFRANENE